MGRGVRRHETGTGRGRDTGGRGCGGMGTEGQHGDTGGCSLGLGRTWAGSGGCLVARRTAGGAAPPKQGRSPPECHHHTR